MHYILLLWKELRVLILEEELVGSLSQRQSWHCQCYKIKSTDCHCEWLIVMKTIIPTDTLNSKKSLF